MEIRNRTMTAKIVKITPTEDLFSITWSMHKRCNNDCMYCGDFLHDNTSPVRPLAELQEHWLQVFEKTKHLGLKYKISITGGEAVINKDFRPFVDWLTDNYRSNIQVIGLTSNGTSSKNYYLGLLEKVTFLTLSTHTETMDVERFVDTAIACNTYSQNTPGKFFMVNIMEEYWALDTIKHLIDVCKTNQIRYSINKIDYYRSGAKEYPVFVINKQNVPRPDLQKSPQVIEAAHRAIQDYANLHTVPTDYYYNVEVGYDDNSSINTYATRLKFLGFSQFEGWQCSAGYKRISIASDSSVYSGECNNRLLGKLSDNSFQLLQAPDICLQRTCTGNPDDLMINKQILGDDSQQA